MKKGLGNYRNYSLIREFSAGKLQEHFLVRKSRKHWSYRYESLAVVKKFKQMIELSPHDAGQVNDVIQGRITK